jgi:Flp pilus assembly protein TadD
MAKHQLFASLTLVSIVLAAASGTHAELAPNINSLTIKKIERATTAPDRRTPNRQLTGTAERSMRYVQMGRAAQKRGADRDALLLFHKAVKLDKTNAYALMAAGDLLGDREEGITCMRAAVKLFRSQRNQEGYDLATGWLEERGINH